MRLTTLITSPMAIMGHHASNLVGKCNIAYWLLATSPITPMASLSTSFYCYLLSMLDIKSHTSFVLFGSSYFLWSYLSHLLFISVVRYLLSYAFIYPCYTVFTQLYAFIYPCYTVFTCSINSQSLLLFTHSVSSVLFLISTMLYIKPNLYL